MSDMKGHDLAVVINRIAGELGVGVLLIEHNIGWVLELCERIFVLDSGRFIEVGPPSQIRARTRSAMPIWARSTTSDSGAVEGAAAS